MRSLPLIIVALLSPPLLAHPGIGRMLLERTVSPDNTCGGTVGYICPASLPCCSKYNWCGSTDAYCGSGCQSAFGTCSAKSSTTTSKSTSTSKSSTTTSKSSTTTSKSSTTTSKSSTTTSKSSTTSSSKSSSSTSKSPSSSSTSSSTGTPTGVVSPDNSCGGTTGYICPSSLPCCSKYGWCGSTDDYCGANCQPAFGTCQGITPDNTCGSPNNYICPSSLPCCSQYGFCGSTADYCGTGCQPGFGTCGGGTSSSTSSSSSSSSSSSTSTSSGSSSTPTDPTANIPRPLVGNVPYGVTITECVTEGDIALTYDDGPYIYTSDLLDILDAAGVKATFFIIGNNGNGAIDQTPAWTSVIQRMYNEGHQVASHTWDHMDLTTLTSAARKEEMYKNEAAFSNILGVFPTYMRPPYLAFDNNCDQCGPDMVALGYHVISTDLDTKDYENDDPTLIQNSKDTFASYTALSPSSNSYIVLTHDIHYQTVYNLTAYEIQRAAATGYRHVTVGECLGDPAANWYRAAPPAAAAAAKANVALAKPQALTVQNFPPPSNVCTFVEDPAIKAVPFVAAVTNSTAKLTRMARLKRGMMSEAVY